MINYIMLRVSIENWNAIGNTMVSNYLDHINIPKCSEMGLSNLFELEPHITMIGDSAGLNIGLNTSDYLIKIKNRDLLSELRSIKLTVSDLKLNTFNNDDAKVLKLDATESKLGQVLKLYHKRLGGNINSYSPHITITYLKPDTPLDIVEDIRSRLQKYNSSTIDLLGVNVSDDNRFIQFFKL